MSTKKGNKLNNGTLKVTKEEKKSPTKKRDTKAKEKNKRYETESDFSEL